MLYPPDLLSRKHINASHAVEHYCINLTPTEIDNLTDCGCRYVALEGPAALHMKGTLVTQAAGSGYTLTEARLGGRLTRHDLSIQQVLTSPHALLCLPPVGGNDHQ